MKIKALSFLLIFSLIMSLTAVYSDAYSEAQKRLMAKRAAKVDALRNLTETVYGVRVDSQTTVRDFVTQSDVIRTRLSAHIQGAREIDYIEHPDGTAEVTVEITVGPVEDILGRRIYYDYQTFRATGYGAPPGITTPPMTTPGPVYSNVVSAKGHGVEPNDPNMSYAEKSLMAKRAAKLDALRNLTEEVYGVRIDSQTSVRDFVTQSDDIRTRIRALIQGARVVSERQLSDASYETIVEMDIGPVRNIIGR